MTDTPVGNADNNGKPPISDILESIKEAEAKVRNLIKDAETRKEKTISEAKRETISIFENSTREGEATRDYMMGEATSKIEADRKKIFEGAEAKAEKVRSQAKSRTGQAKELLLKDFMRAIDDQA